MENDIKIKRLRYRSWHRGWKETDLILGTFADENLDKMSAEEINVYEKLLDENDADIWDWLVEREKPKDMAYETIMEKLRVYGRNVGA